MFVYQIEQLGEQGLARALLLGTLFVSRLIHNRGVKCYVYL